MYWRYGFSTPNCDFTNTILLPVRCFDVSLASLARSHRLWRWLASARVNRPYRMVPYRRCLLQDVEVEYYLWMYV